jgi:hypothetical protein
MRESWSTRWYTPLVALGGLVALLLMLAVGSVEMLTTDAPSAVAPSAWTTPLDLVDAALARGDDVAARSAWYEAHAAALRSAQWEGMMAVGDASRRLGADGPVRARQAYITALFRARRERSLEGLLRAASAFGDLGDREVMGHALLLAEHEAGRDPLKRARVRTVADRWKSSSLAPENRDSTLLGGQQP